MWRFFISLESGNQKWNSLGHLITPCLMVWGMIKWFSNVAVSLYFPFSNVQGFQFSTFLLTHYNLYFLILAILVSTRLYLYNVVLTIFTSLDKCLFICLANFFIWVICFYYCWSIRVHIFWIKISGKYMIFKHCFPFCGLAFHLLDGVSCSTSFKFWWSPVDFFLLSPVRSWRLTLMFPLRVL